MRKRLTVTTSAALALLILRPAAGDEKCGVCHSEERVIFEASVHAREHVGCVGCHGGDAQTLATEAAHRGAFRSLGERADIPELCGGCHSDLEMMRPYNLPVDQLAIYRTSQHGRAVAAGDDRAAVCTDCHGGHNVLAAGDPQSMVYGRHIPDTCGRCHADPKLMADYGYDPQVIAAYRSGIHGTALLAAGNLAAPNCTNCHGVHGAAPPQFSDIDKVCGSCHVHSRRAFLEGRHYESMVAADLPECVACHEDHGIRRFDAAGITAVCIRCHDEGSDEALVGDKIRTLITTARDQVDLAEQRVREAQRVPLEVEDHLSRLEEARTYLTEALPLVHMVSQEAVQEVTRRARSIGKEVEHELDGELDRTMAHVGLAAFWFYLIMTLAILWAYKRRVRRRAKTKS